MPQRNRRNLLNLRFLRQQLLLLRMLLQLANQSLQQRVLMPGLEVLALEPRALRMRFALWPLPLRHLPLLPRQQQLPHRRPQNLLRRLPRPRPPRCLLRRHRLPLRRPLPRRPLRRRLLRLLPHQLLRRVCLLGSLRLLPLRQ